MDLHGAVISESQVRLRRVPNLKRGRNEGRITERIKLERVFGATVSNNAALATDPITGIIAYPAGCTVVLYNPSTERQQHIVNASKKSITCLAFSSCGRYVVTGECGHQPAVRVWDLVPDAEAVDDVAVQQIAEFVGHKFGVSCVAFSPTSKVVVSVGTQHDMIVNVWEWRKNVKLASNKVSTKVKAIAFAENGSYFVTVGNRLVKFWYLDCGRKKYNKEAVPLMGRSAILGEQRNNNFVDVACGRSDCGDNTYVITRSGLLCQFNNRRLLDKWVELRTSSANSLSVGEKHIFVGCDNGIVRCFDPQTLQFVTTLPRTHYLGVDVAQGLNIAHMAAPPAGAKYPDAVAISYDTENHKVTCVYNDHSIYIWDVRNILKVGKSDSFLFHSACIWGVEIAPADSPFPTGSFLTCSSDDTIRVWTLDRFDDTALKGMYVRNIYSHELLKVVYVDPELAFLKDVRTGTTNDSSYDSVNGVRSIRLNPDGTRLASGDRTGNIRIHETSTMNALLKIEAHDSEVLCLEFSGEDVAGSQLMASASRDRLIHVFDVNHDFHFLQTLDDHSSSITSVRFLHHQMVSCGADKSVIFRKLAGTPNGKPQFQRAFNVTGKYTLYDMEVDAGEKHVLTACQDRNVRIYNVAQGRYTRSYKGSAGDDGSLIKLALDKSGTYLATSCTDKSLSVYDYYTGECMATMSGHSELATGLRFTNDCRRIISTSGDGCIFVWKVPHDMVVTMHARLNQQAMLSGKKLDPAIASDAIGSDSDEEYLNTSFDRRFNVSKLPRWAKKKLMSGSGGKFSTNESAPDVVQPQGKWAERAQKMYAQMPSDVESSLESDRGDHGVKSPQVMRGTEEVMEESAAVDGDVDSDQECRRQALYYPDPMDPSSGNEFTVNQIDTEELRKSVRRAKRASLPPLNLHTGPVSPSDGDDDDDDDDEASTPSGENTDANPMSMLSTSMESLYANKEKCLQSTYESLSGSEAATPGSPATGKSSITAQYHSRRSMPTSLRNVAVVNAAKHTKNDIKTTKKREELNKMIAETKKKLQSTRIETVCCIMKLVANQLNKNRPEVELCVPMSQSVPNDLQLCGCYMREIERNLTYHVGRPTKLADILSKSPEKYVQSLAALIQPRKQHLDRTLRPIKHKHRPNNSLPVSPVSEDEPPLGIPTVRADRKSFSYFRSEVEKREESAEVGTEYNFKQICADIEKFSRDFSRNYQAIEDIFNGAGTNGDIFVNEGAGFQKKSAELKTSQWLANEFQDTEDPGNFSSDSLEDCSFNSTRPCRTKHHKLSPPRRCVSNNDLLYHTGCDDDVARHFPKSKSQSFYLNDANSQESILSSEENLLERKSRSYCNSMESILSNDSDCKSAPLECLFRDGDSMRRSKSLMEGAQFPHKQLKTVQTQTDFETPREVVMRKSKSSEFQLKLLKFEQHQHYRPPVAFFVGATESRGKEKMEIPTLQSKNAQYKSKYCSVLNNKPECNPAKQMLGNPQFTLTTQNLPMMANNLKNKNILQETASLDRHLLAKGLIDEQKIYHKPPKAVRRHHSAKLKRRSLQTRTTYEYVKKDELDHAKRVNNEENTPPTGPTTTSLQFSYKENNAEKELEDGASTEEPLRREPEERSIGRNLTQIQTALENIQILNEIQAKIAAIYNLVELFKTSLAIGKVKALSTMYDNLNKSVGRAEDSRMELKPPKRNLSLPNFLDLKYQSEDMRNLNFRIDTHSEDKTWKTATNMLDVEVQRSGSSALDLAKSRVSVANENGSSSSMRRVCSLSDLSLPSGLLYMPNDTLVNSKHTNSAVAKRSEGKGLLKNTQLSRLAPRQLLPMARSSSTGVLNHSDSDDDHPQPSKQLLPSRLMRPTISSQNKAAQSSISHIGGKSASRVHHHHHPKRHHSSLNLSTVNQDGTSSDEVETTKVNNAKPAVPPRARGLPATNPVAANRVKWIKPDVVADPTTITGSYAVKESNKLCHDVASNLIHAAGEVVKLHGALTSSAVDMDNNMLSEEARNDMVHTLQVSVVNTQKLLQDLSLQILKHENRHCDVVNQTDSVKKLNDLIEKGFPTDEVSLISIMQQYSDILLGMMQQKIQDCSK